jgi:hypothetical protein
VPCGHADDSNHRSRGQTSHTFSLAHDPKVGFLRQIRGNYRVAEVTNLNKSARESNNQFIRPSAKVLLNINTPADKLIICIEYFVTILKICVGLKNGPRIISLAYEFNSCVGIKTFEDEVSMRCFDFIFRGVERRFECPVSLPNP